MSSAQSITFFNQWIGSKWEEFSVIVFEYKSIYDPIDDDTSNVLIIGLLGFGIVIVFNVR